MKKAIFCTLLSLFGFTGLNYFPAAEAKKGHKQNHKHHNKAKKKIKKQRVFVTPRRVFVAPVVGVQPNIVVHTMPIITLNPGYFYFSTRSPAFITANRARLHGYRANVSLLNNRWVVFIR